MSMKDFVRRAEISSKNNINRAYRDIDFLYWQLDFLNDLLQRYSNKKSGMTLSNRSRQEEMNNIREQVPRVYQHINYYKECINAEKKEMKRIYDTYGFVPTQYHKYENNNENTKKYDEYEDDYVNYNADNNYEDDYDGNSEISEPEVENLEEIIDYKYNSVTDTWE